MKDPAFSIKSKNISGVQMHYLSPEPHLQWRRQDFFGGTPRLLYEYQPPTAWSPGASAPGMETKFKIFKRFKVLENESIFQKFECFLPENAIYLCNI